MIGSGQVSLPNLGISSTDKSMVGPQGMIDCRNGMMLTYEVDTELRRAVFIHGDYAKYVYVLKDCHAQTSPSSIFDGFPTHH